MSPHEREPLKTTAMSAQDNTSMMKKKGYGSLYLLVTAILSTVAFVVLFSTSQRSHNTDAVDVAAGKPISLLRTSSACIGRGVQCKDDSECCDTPFGGIAGNYLHCIPPSPNGGFVGEKFCEPTCIPSGTSCIVGVTSNLYPPCCSGSTCRSGRYGYAAECL